MASTDDSPHADDGVMTSRPGSILAGRYRVDTELGRGVLGELMRGEDLELARPVALRLVPPELSGGDELVARLELRRNRNARLPRGDVPLLVDLLDLLDLGRDDRGQLFVVTDVFPRDSLADLLVREGPPAWQRLRALMVRACQIVHLSHEHGMIRQDLSTSSLYPVRDKNDPGTLKVVSPGLLVASGGRVWSCADVEAARALARYAAPEQISTGVVDRRTDVYALGVILYECLTGQVPFADPRPAHVLAAHLITPPAPFAAAVRRRIPAGLEAIVLRALAKSPDDRWPTVMALANAMAAIDVGRCEFSGMLHTGDTDDLTEHLEPQQSATSMRIDAARLSGRAGLVPAADPAATGEHAFRDILGAAESSSRLVSSAASSSASLSRTDASDSALTRITSPDDSAPTLAYGVPSESAARWSVRPGSGPRPAAPPRRLIPWLLAAGLSLVTAGVVSGVLRPAPAPPLLVAAVPPGAATMGPASPGRGWQPVSEAIPAATSGPGHPRASATEPAASRSPTDAIAPGSRSAGPSAPLTALAPDLAPPGVPTLGLDPLAPAGLLAHDPASVGARPQAAPALPLPAADALPQPVAAGPLASPSVPVAGALPPPSPSVAAGPLASPPDPGDAVAEVPGSPAGRRPGARPKSAAPLPRKTAPGARLPDPSGHELPDPAAPEPAAPAP